MRAALIVSGLLGLFACGPAVTEPDAGAGGGTTGRAGGAGGGSSSTGGGSSGGGSAAGGSAGGAAAGGSAAGGTAGGDAGGSAAGGSAGGGTAGGDAGGSAAGGSAGGAGDTTPPTILSTTPPANATGVAGGTDAGITVSIDFSEPIDPASFMVSFLPPATLVGTPNFSNGNASASVTTAAPLNPGASYTVSVVARDLANNALAPPTMFGFTTAAVLDTTPPTVTSTVPAANAIDVPTMGLTVSATFSEPVTPSTVVGTIVGPLDLGSPTMSMGNRVATWSMPTLDDGGVATFQPSTSYTVTVEASDTAGNAMAMPYQFVFTTASPPDTTPPTLVNILPADLSTAIPVNSSVVLTFSEPMNTASVEAGLRFNGSARAGTFAWSPGNATVRFTPTANWANNTAYTVAFNPAPTDTSANALVAVSRSFTTNATVDTTAVTVTNRSPNTGATGVPTRTGCAIFRSNTDVTLTFSGPVDRVSAAAAFAVLQGTMSVPGTITFNAAGTTLTFTPVLPFAFNTTFTVRLNQGATIALDLQGNPIASVNYTFSTMRELNAIIFNTPTQSGRILSGAVAGQNTVANNVAIRVGEFTATVRSRGHLTFDLGSQLPGNTYCVSAATLQLEQTGVNGTPYGSASLGDLVSEVVNFGLAIDAPDYAAAPVASTIFTGPNTTTLSTDPMLGVKSAQVAGQVRLALGNGNIRWRLRFTNDAMSSGTIDNASFQNTTLNGRLVIRYEAP